MFKKYLEVETFLSPIYSAVSFSQKTSPYCAETRDAPTPSKPCFILCAPLTYFNGAYDDNINILITFTLYSTRCGFNTMSAQCSVVLFIHSCVLTAKEVGFRALESETFECL